ncbi:SOS response-associated peptidase [Pseudobutyrivibrio xylanivorans]|uniref:Abasic site processing protein n=1 Tax=Pseudobutyrivibrio xylanivorans TaxID=185007 RepID=A0A1G5S563_PSEXY|nr:SOS response-associated peptidase family protein [Pseudobutyrivibrio xylanivorans]SCZ81297.1 Putative SOS response-associated peptidase YedK [Pseudobutyrivibrio xylanivorans]
MCTRYALDITIDELREIMEVAEHSPLTMKFIDTHARPLVTDGEVRPTDIVPVIAPNSKGVKSVFPMQWGFMARDNKRTLFNARVETAGEKPTFKDAWQSHRCIIPAAYYYEWEHLKNPDGKVQTGDKYAIQPTGSTTTWLCGLYRIEEGYPVFVILTQEPTEELGKIHDRMPVMLPKDKIEQWINPASNPRDLISQALTDMVIEKAE